ncbi:hypothetical protein NECAME_03690 [Necator americanus]|uniref:Uncharacterized protein n=1 Tax=Necator americanus TaxID=51031 RepID=W2T1D0_NECAM|nr:hypothetical protein NECAME_03690 [Necator americanus]ETN75718.1 hypothetical protein NECAME_03690 [Necator americanus]
MARAIMVKLFAIVTLFVHHFRIVLALLRDDAHISTRPHSALQTYGASEIVDLPSESGRQKAPVKVVIEKQLLDKGGLENEVVHVPRKVNGGGIELRDLPRFPSEKRRSHGQRTRTVEQLAVELEADHRPSFKGEIIAEGRMLARQNMSRKEANNNSGVFLDTLTVDLPKHLKPAKEKKILVAKQSTFSEDDEKYTVGQSQISDVLRELETATDFKTPLDDEHIRKVLRRNRKLMKALVEAYKLRTTTSTTTIATSSLPDEEDELNLYPSTTDESQDLSTATEPTANSTSTDDPNLQEDETTTSNFNTELPSTTEESSSSSEFLSATSDESEESSTPDNVSYIYDNPLDGDVRVPTRTTAESDFSDQGFTENTKPTEATVQHSESAVTEETDGKSFTDLLTSQDFDESSDALASNSFAENEDLEAYETTPSTTSVMTTEATTTTTTTPPYWPRKVLLL